jgi:hypothetical protein
MRHPLLAILLSLALLMTNTKLCPSQFNAANPPQSNQTLSSQAEKIKRQVEKFGIGKDVTVILIDNREYYGAIGNIEADGFQIAEIDLKQRVSFRFSEVKKVRKGYGGWNSAAGKRVNPRTNLIAGIAVLGGLALLLGIALSQDK